MRQLCDALREGILSGSIPAGSKLPSTRDAARELGTARNVAISAYEQLEAEGYLEGIAGSGTRVAQTGVTPARAEPRKRIDTALPSERKDVIDFASACGIPELTLFPYPKWRHCLLKAYDSASIGSFSFNDARGDERLRASLAELLFRTRGINCSPSQIFITQGITDALSLTTKFLRRKTGCAILEDPVLNSFKRVLAQSDFRVDYVPVDDSGLVSERIPISGEPRLCVVSPSHQFPSGTLLPISRRLELIERVAKTGGWIFEDDYDGDLRLRGLAVPPLFTLAPNRIFYAGTFNKSLFPAIRTGYLVVPEEYVEAFSLFRLGLSDWTGSIVSGALACFIDEGHYDRHLFTLKKEYRARRETVQRELAAAFGPMASVHGYEAGTHCRVSLPPADWQKSERHGIKVATIARYQADPKAKEGDANFRNDIVLGYGNLPGESIVKGISRMRTFLA
jgi:GntR family transcriptional regulator/MocR family aminotransferase